jgi:hypothetical protein
MQHQKQKPVVDGNELIRSLRRSPKHLAKLRARLLASGVRDREIVAAIANSRTLVSPLKIIRGGTR